MLKVLIRIVDTTYAICCVIFGWAVLERLLNRGQPAPSIFMGFLVGLTGLASLLLKRLAKKLEQQEKGGLNAKRHRVL